MGKKRRRDTQGGKKEQNAKGDKAPISTFIKTLKGQTATRTKIPKSQVNTSEKPPGADLIRQEIASSKITGLNRNMDKT